MGALLVETCALQHINALALVPMSCPLNNILVLNYEEVCLCVCVARKKRRTQRRESQGVTPEIRRAASESGPVVGYIPDLVCRQPYTPSVGFPRAPRAEWQDSGGVNYRRP